MQETQELLVPQVQSLGQEDPLQEEMATQSCLGNPHGLRSLEGYSLWGYKEPDTTEWVRTHACAHTHTSKIDP